MAGNLIAMFVGVVFFVLGVALTIHWQEDFFKVFHGCVGVTLVFVGLLAMVIGYSEHKATKEFEAATSGPSPEPPTPPSEPTSALADESKSS